MARTLIKSLELIAQKGEREGQLRFAAVGPFSHAPEIEHRKSAEPGLVEHHFVCIGIDARKHEPAQAFAVPRKKITMEMRE